MNSRNYIKTQKSAIFVKKNLKKNINLKRITKLWTIVIIQEIIEVLHMVYVKQSISYIKKFK